MCVCVCVIVVFVIYRKSLLYIQSTLITCQPNTILSFSLGVSGNQKVCTVHTHTHTHTRTRTRTLAHTHLHTHTHTCTHTHTHTHACTHTRTRTHAHTHTHTHTHTILHTSLQLFPSDDNMIHPEMLQSSPVNRGFVSHKHKRNNIRSNSTNSPSSEVPPHARRGSDETLTPLDTPRTSEVCIQPVQLEPVVEEVFPSTSTLAKGDILSQGESVTPKPRQLRRKRSLSVPDIFERLQDLEEVRSGEETLVESEEELQANLSESPTGSNSELEYCASVSESQSTSVVASPSPTYPRSLSNSPPNGKDYKSSFTMPAASKDRGISPSFLNIPQNSPMHNSTSNPEGLNTASDSKCQDLNRKSGSHDLSKGKKPRESLEQTSMTPQLGRKKRRSKIVKGKSVKHRYCSRLGFGVSTT